MHLFAGLLINCVASAAREAGMFAAQEFFAGTQDSHLKNSEAHGHVKLYTVAVGRS